MADRRDQLVVVHELLDDLHCPLLQPHLVGVADAAGQQQRVELLRVDRLQRQVGRDRLGLLAVVHHALDRVGLDRGERHARAGVEQRLARLEQLVALEAVGGEDQDACLG